MLITIRRTITWVCLLGLIASNILSLTWGAFNASLSTALYAATNVETVMQKRTKAAKRYGKKAVRRASKIAKRTVASIPMEIIPYAGAAAVLSFAALDLADYCGSMKDVDALYADMDLEKETKEGSMTKKVCNIKIPSIDDVLGRHPEETKETVSEIYDSDHLIDKISGWAISSEKTGDKSIFDTEEEKNNFIELAKIQYQKAKLWMQSKNGDQ